MSLVVITRERNGTVNGVKLTGRCYVTGPHFNVGVFSSTDDRAQASRYTPDEAERLIRTHRTWVLARAEEVTA